MLITHLAPEQCCDRLRSHVTSWYYMPTQRDLREGGRVLGGRVSSRGFSVYKKDNTRNSFRPVASGTFAPIPGGTRIEARAGTPTWVRIFSTLWLAVVGAAAIAAILVAGAHVLGGGSLGSAAPSLIPAAMFAAGVGLTRYSSASSREEGPYLLKLLARALDAERVGPGDP